MPFHTWIPWDTTVVPGKSSWLKADSMNAMTTPTKMSPPVKTPQVAPLKGKHHEKMREARSVCGRVGGGGGERRGWGGAEGWEVRGAGKGEGGGRWGAPSGPGGRGPRRRPRSLRAGGGRG